MLVVLVASLAAGIMYFAMRATMSSEEREQVQNESAVATTHVEARPPVPQPRPVELPHGVEQLLVTSSLLALTVVIGRYVFRLRL